MNIAEKTAVQGLALAGLSTAEIARQTGRSRDTIAKVLSGEEFKQAKELARSALAEGLTDFVTDWRRASKAAAEKGNHDPAKDAMLSLGAISQPTAKRESGSGFVVRIGVLLPGLGETAKLAIDAGDVVERFTASEDLDSDSIEGR